MNRKYLKNKGRKQKFNKYFRKKLAGSKFTLLKKTGFDPTRFILYSKINVIYEAQ